MRTEALIALITVMLRAATLVSQSLLVGGIAFHRWVAARPSAPDEPGPGTRLVRRAAVALAITQGLFLGLNTMLLRSSVGLSFVQTTSANFFLAGMVTISAALAKLGRVSAAEIYERWPTHPSSSPRCLQAGRDGWSCACPGVNADRSHISGPLALS